MDRQDYESYLKAFNAKDYDAVCDFYHEPMNLSFFGVELGSREEMKRFYKFLHSYVNESVSIKNFASSQTLTAVDAVVRIEAFADLDQKTLEANGCGALHPIQAGQVQELRQFIFYTIRDKKIEKVECAMAA